MKSLLCLFLLAICLSFSVPAIAEDASVRGVIGKEKKIAPATPEQMEEAFKVSDECKAYDYTNTHYDCDCIGMTFLELRRKAGNAVQAFQLKETAKKKCPNAPQMAGMIYTRCLAWAPSRLGEDYNAFCGCYGSEFAKIYAKNPSENQLVREYQMTRALTACNIGQVNQRKQDAQKMVRKLKQDGIYDELLPGAALSNDLTNKSTIKQK